MTKNSKAGSGCLKKTTVVVLLFILSAALCFAGGQKSDGGGKKIELEVVTWHPVLSDFYNKLFAEYNAAHPDVNVIITAKAGSEAMYAYVTTIMQSGSEGADLFTSHGSKLVYLGNYADAGAIVNLDGKLDVSSFPRLMVQRASHKGHLYMSPGVFGDAFMVFYNKDIFNKYNIQIPRTFAEFESICKLLVSRSEVPFAVAGRDQWGLNFFTWQIQSVNSLDWSEKFCKGIGDFSDPAFLNGMRIAKQWLDAGYAGPNWKSQERAGALIQFTSGKAAMYASNTGGTSGMAASGMNYGGFYMPMPQGGSYLMAGQDTATGFSLRASGNKVKEEKALELLRFLTSDAVNQKLSDMSWNLPYKTSITTPNAMLNSLKTADKVIPLWVDQMTPRGPEGVDGIMTLVDYVSRYMMGGVTDDEFIRVMQTTIDPNKKMSDNQQVSW